MRNKILILILSVLLVLVFSKCASIKHIPINDENTDRKNKGIRYYQSSPYLIIYSNGKGGIVTQIEYLPDPTKKMSAVIPKSFMATIKTALEFDNGVLTSSTGEIDTTAVPKAILKAVETVGTAYLAAFNIIKEKAKNFYTVPAPYIYKIVVKGNDVIFIGAQGDHNFKVTLLPQKKEKK